MHEKIENGHKRKDFKYKWQISTQSRENISYHSTKKRLQSWHETHHISKNTAQTSRTHIKYWTKKYKKKKYKRNQNGTPTLQV